MKDFEQMTLFDVSEHESAKTKTAFDDYEGFVEKFKLKKTTDDCYTPPLIMETVNEWVSKEYGVDRMTFVRPFYPGGTIRL